MPTLINHLLYVGGFLFIIFLFPVGPQGGTQNIIRFLQTLIF